MPALTLLDGGTTATTGGSNQEFNPTGKNVTNGVAYVDIAVADITEREEVILTSRAANYNAATGWTKQKCRAQYTVPFVNTEGDMFFSLVRIDIEVAPAHLASVTTIVDTLREKGAQLLVDSELDGFWDTGARP